MEPKEAVAAFLTRFPQLEVKLLSPSSVAAVTGVEVVISPTTSRLGSISSINQSGRRGYRIRVSASNVYTSGRFSLAHELAHFWLYVCRDEGRDIGPMDSELIEQFCDRFAAELLGRVAIGHGYLKNSELDGVKVTLPIQTPKEFLAVASRSGLSLDAFMLNVQNGILSLPVGSNWFIRSRSFLSIKRRENYKPRVVRAVYDNKRFYIIPNRGLDSLIAERDCVRLLTIGEERSWSRVKITLLKRSFGQSPHFHAYDFTSNLLISCRLSNFKSDRSENYLIALEPPPESRQEAS